MHCTFPDVGVDDRVLDAGGWVAVWGAAVAREVEQEEGKKKAPRNTTHQAAPRDICQGQSMQFIKLCGYVKIS